MAEITELSQEQEINLIGALLKDPTRLKVVMEIIKPEDIWLQRARMVYEAMVKLTNDGLTVDTVTVGDELERHGQLDGVGGRMKLQDFRENFRGDNPESYAYKILDYSAKREMVEHFSTGATWSNNGRDSNAIRDDMIRRLTDVRTPNSKADSHNQTLKEALSNVYDRISEGKKDYIETGLIDLDMMLKLQPPDLLIVAGRPGQGKTSLMLSMALAAAKKNKRVLFLSLEMSNEQITMRLVSMETGVPYGALADGQLTAKEWETVNGKIEKLEGLPLHFNDMPAISINKIRQAYRKLEAIHGKFDLVVVDYLQLQSPDGNYGTREQEVSSISRGLKATAKEFHVPVIAGAQLSRAIEQRASKKPVLSDLRESGGIEQDSDKVVFIHQEEETDADINLNRPTPVDLIVAKNRNGRVGKASVLFDKRITKFVNASVTNTKLEHLSY